MTVQHATARAKILDLDVLVVIAAQARSEGRRIVQSHGVFDLLHVGHIRHFEQAKALGDVLIVTLTPDEYVNKGPGRPAFPHQLRAEAVAALVAVDYVAINRWPQATEAIKMLRPHVYAKGQDYRTAGQDITGGIVPETDAVHSVGGSIQFTDDITFSSSELLNRHFSAFPAETDRYLTEFRRTHSVDHVLSWLERASKLRPMVVGETIIDEYEYCDGIGKSTKDPVLAVLFDSMTTLPGGTLAIANHLAGLCGGATLVTSLGDRERREDFVRQALAPNVEPVLLTKSGSPTIHKRRIVDQYSGNKLFEIYVMDDRLTAGADEQALQAALASHLAKVDLTIVADYGHGMLPPSAIETLCAAPPFLAVNVQSNAGNRGFNPVSKYRRADYVCLAMHEIAMETRSRDGSVHDRVKEVATRVDCSRFTVTKGKAGSLHYETPDQFFEYPSLASRVLDRVGAGDGVLAATSLLLKCGAPWDIVGFVGNVAGAELVAELGNRVPLNRISLSKHITALMK